MASKRLTLAVMWLDLPDTNRCGELTVEIEGEITIST